MKINACAIGILEVEHHLGTNGTTWHISILCSAFRTGVHHHLIPIASQACPSEPGVCFPTISPPLRTVFSILCSNFTGTHAILYDVKPNLGSTSSGGDGMARHLLTSQLSPDEWSTDLKYFYRLFARPCLTREEGKTYLCRIRRVADHNITLSHLASDQPFSSDSIPSSQKYIT